MEAKMGALTLCTAKLTQTRTFSVYDWIFFYCLYVYVYTDVSQTVTVSYPGCYRPIKTLLGENRTQTKQTR